MVGLGRVGETSVLTELLVIKRTLQDLQICRKLPVSGFEIPVILL
jgi:hypothetical protein